MREEIERQLQQERRERKTMTTWERREKDNNKCKIGESKDNNDDARMEKERQ